MPLLQLSLPQETIDRLEEFSREDGRSVETLAEDAVNEAALRADQERGK